jgi:hypothetical protein
MDWIPVTIAEVRQSLAQFERPWWIAGGWALDLFVGEETRSHEDVDIMIQSQDQERLREILKDWDLQVVTGPGKLKTWGKGEKLEPGRSVWGRRSSDGPWELEILFLETNGEKWIYRRDSRITGTIAEMGLVNKQGLRYLAPEVQLLYKSKVIREKDEQDFHSVLPHLDREQKNRLKKSLLTVYGSLHPWIGFLE